MTSAAPAIAVLMPCYKEEAAVARVVRGFKAALRTRRSMSTTTTPPTAPHDRDYDHYHDAARSPNPSNQSWKPLARHKAETCAGIAIELLQRHEVPRYRGVRGPAARFPNRRASLILLAISATR